MSDRRRFWRRVGYAALGILALALLQDGWHTHGGFAALAQTVEPLLIKFSTTGSDNDVDVTSLPANTTVDLNRVAGAAPSATNPVPSRLTDGTSFYDARGITSFPDNEPFNQNQIGGTAVAAGPCEREVPVFKEIDQTAGEQLVTGTASERIYICSFNIITATAQNIALVSGTGTVCATSTGPIFGGTTAATGWNFAANGGLVLPDTRGFYGKTDTDADNLCLLMSGSGQISGGVTYVSIPNI